MGDSLAAVDVGNGTIVSVTANTYFTCVSMVNTSSASVDVRKCFGRNLYGQLGQGDTPDQVDEMGEDLAAIDLPTLTKDCALTASPTTAPSLAPVATLPVNLTSPDVELTLGYAHACVLSDDNGSVACWGENSYGQLGYGDTANRGAMGGEMGDALDIVDLGSGFCVSKIAANEMVSCTHTHTQRVIICQQCRSGRTATSPSWPPVRRIPARCWTTTQSSAGAGAHRSCPD